MNKVNKLKSKDGEFPDSFRVLSTVPDTIWHIGDASLLHATPMISIVGSRKVSSYGIGITKQLATELAKQGIVVASGLALGVDSLAHEAALKAGGKTIAVLPCGLDRVYPATHTQLAKQIIEQGGLLISEYPPLTMPGRQSFIARNRLIAALGEGLLITEAAIRSGSLHTANFALEQGKTVMAVPGNITSPLSAGTNNLIKSGAIPITETTDVLQAMKWNEKVKKELPHGKTEAEAIIIGLLNNGVKDGAELLIQSGLTAELYNQSLTMLEINGSIQSLGGDTWGLR